MGSELCFGSIFIFGSQVTALRKGGDHLYMFCSSLREWGSWCQTMKHFYLCFEISSLFGHSSLLVMGKRNVLQVLFLGLEDAKMQLYIS